MAQLRTFVKQKLPSAAQIAIERYLYSLPLPFGLLYPLSRGTRTTAHVDDMRVPIGLPFLVFQCHNLALKEKSERTLESNMMVESY